FDHEALLTDKSGRECRVLLGPHLGLVEILEKEEVARSRCYSGLFDKRGHFKQCSTVVSSCPLGDRPTQSMRAVARLPEEIDTTAESYIEGAVRSITVNADERDPAARLACIRHYGARCAICGFSFADKYGPLLEDYL